MRPRIALALLMLLPPLLAAGPNLVVELPASGKAQSAVAVAPQLKLETRATVIGQKLTFANLLPDTAYDVKITLADGTVLCGVDLAWPGTEPAKKDAEPLDDDDRQQLKDLFDGVKAFENKRNQLFLVGDHDRAVILAELIRDSAFHSDAGGETIWRIEVWYFKNQHGGWERVVQSNKVLRRERFKTRQDYQTETSKLKWLPGLGGVRLTKDETKILRLKAEDLTAKGAA